MNVRVWQIDLEEKTAKNWYHPGGIPTEPFFVPRPGATEEDDGEFFNWRKMIFGNGRYSERQRNWSHRLILTMFLHWERFWRGRIIACLQVLPFHWWVMTMVEASCLCSTAPTSPSSLAPICPTVCLTDSTAAGFPGNPHTKSEVYSTLKVAEVRIPLQRAAEL